jgi:hypothetical protein
MDKLLQELDSTSQEILDSVKKSKGTDQPDVSEPEKPAEEPSQLEKVLGKVNKSLDLLNGLWKANGKKDDEGEDTDEGTAEVEMEEEEEVEKAYPSSNYDDFDVPDDDVHVDAGPILKALDYNMGVFDERLERVEKIVETLAKSQVASLDMQKAITASVGTLVGGVSDIIEQPLPFKSEQVGNKPKQPENGAINLWTLYKSNKAEWQKWHDRIEKACKDGRIEPDVGVACFDDHMIPADLVPILTKDN